MSIASEITRLQTAKSDLKDAIEAKGVTVDSSATLDDYADLVASISGGGGEDDRKDLCNPKDVDFVDYDGRLLYSYTVDEFAELTALPPNPTNTGLVAQGWNWTLADAQPFVAEYGGLVIGQNYTTDTGRTRIYIHLTHAPADGKITCTPTVKNGIKVYWGDGDTTIFGTANSNGTTSHTYTENGDYLIEVEVLDGEIKLLGTNSTGGSFVGNSRLFTNGVYKVEIGDNVTHFGGNIFGQCANLEVITIPKTIGSSGDNSDSWFPVNRLNGIVFPSGFNGKYRGMFPSNSSLKYISIPKSATNFHVGTNCRRLRKLTMYSLQPSSGVKNTVQLYDVWNLTHFILPGTYTEIVGDTCRSSFIEKLFIPASVTKINATAFVYNSKLTEVHLRPTTPPTLSNVNAFGSGPSNRIYYVPYSEDHSILEAYQTATNWSTYASQMQEEDPT